MAGNGARFNGEASTPLQDEAEELRRQYRETAQPGSPLPPWLKPLTNFDPLDLAEAEYPPFERPWLIDGWLPLNETVGLCGYGGEGKTLLAQMLATAAAMESSWLGLPVQRMKSALVLCEDRANDALWRQRDIDRHYGSTLKTLAPWMQLFPLRDHDDNYLAIFDRDDVMHLTTFFAQLLDKLKKFAGPDPLLTILDTKSDIFWGQQNNERHARSFVRLVCDRIARETNGIVLLLFHPSMAGKREGTGTSGSVQWQAAFRSHLLLETPDDAKDGQRTLTLLKNTFAERDKTRDITWDKGVFITQEDADSQKPDYERAAENSRLKTLVREAYDNAKKRCPYLSPIERSPYYAAHKIATDLRLAKHKITDDEIARTIQQLIEAGEFVLGEYKAPNGRPTPAILRA